MAMQRFVRRAVLTRLAADAGVTTLVPATSIYPQTVDGEPAWPFIKLGALRLAAFRASCVSGADVSFDIHAFARDREVGGQVVETAEDHAARIGAAIEAALDYHGISLENGGRATLRLSDQQLMPDGESDAFHWFAQINAKTFAP